MTSYTSSIDLGRMLQLIREEGNPLVKADLLRQYVDGISYHEHRGKPVFKLYQNAFLEYTDIIRQLNGQDKELKSALERRAKECARKAGIQ